MANEYLVQYGRTAYLGKFEAAELQLERGQSVIIQSLRGREFGEILGPAHDRFTRTFQDSRGTILRVTNEDDIRYQTDREQRAEALLNRAIERAEQLNLPIAFFDSECLFDGTTAILYGLSRQQLAADALFAELSQEWNLDVRYQGEGPMVESPEAAESGGCGKEGCGSKSGSGCSTSGSGGGCSTGSCSKGSVKSAEELSTYFSHLRSQMEQAGLVRTPLN
jgi:cell fate regulator YaaT (PSP1 superfamily)